MQTGRWIRATARRFPQVQLGSTYWADRRVLSTQLCNQATIELSPFDYLGLLIICIQQLRDDKQRSLRELLASVYTPTKVVCKSLQFLGLKTGPVFLGPSNFFQLKSPNSIAIQGFLYYSHPALLKKSLQPSALQQFKDVFLNVYCGSNKIVKSCSQPFRRTMSCRQHRKVLSFG